MATAKKKAPGAAAKKLKAAKADKAPKQAKATDEKIKGAKSGGADRGPLSGAGHNLTQVKKLILPYKDRYNRYLDQKEEENARYMADVRTMIEDAANDLGCKMRLVGIALKEQRRAMKQEEKEKEMDQAEVDQLDTMRDALGLFADTELGQAATKAAQAKPTPNPKAPAKAKVSVTAKKSKANGSGTVVPMPAKESTLAEDENEGRPAAA